MNQPNPEARLSRLVDLRDIVRARDEAEQMRRPTSRMTSIGDVVAAGQMSDAPMPAMNTMRNNATGAEYQFQSANSSDGQSHGAGGAGGVQLDYSQPIEIFGQGKGYAIKGQPLAAMINGRRVDYGVDQAASKAATQATQDRSIKLAQAQQGLDAGALDMDLKRVQIGQAAAKPSKRDDALYSAGIKALTKEDADVKQAADLEAKAKRFQELNQVVDTGRVMGRAPAWFNPEKQEMEAIQNYFVLNNFKPGQGAISNIERQFMKGAGPQTINDKEANDNITRIMLGGVENMRERFAFREQWLQQHGSLLGSDAVWQKYVDANPRYVPQDGGGKLVDNTAREDWSRWVDGVPATPNRNRARPPIESFRR